MLGEEDEVEFGVDGSVQLSPSSGPSSVTASQTRPQSSIATTLSTRQSTPWSLPEGTPLTPALCKTITNRRRKNHPADDRNPKVELERKHNFVPRPVGQGPFREAWEPLVRKRPTPAQMLAQLSRAQSSQARNRATFGNGWNKFGERRVSTPGFGGYAGRDGGPVAFSWMGHVHPDGGPGESYSTGAGAYHRRRSTQSSSAGLPYAPASWARAARKVQWWEEDKELFSEFHAPVDINCVKRAPARWTMRGPLSYDKPGSASPGPAVYYPGIDFARSESARPQSFSQGKRVSAIEPTSNTRDLCNSGPKFIPKGLGGKDLRYWNNCGTQSQCTFARTERFPMDLYVDAPIG